MSSKKASSTSSSVAIIEGNDDLLIEVLVLLPAESLVRFKVVSKRWRSLISAPWFWRRRHHHRETQPSFILSGKGTKYMLCKPRGGPTLFPLLFASGISLVQVVQSCNGLLLMRCRTEYGRRRMRYYVFNPTTLQRRPLATLPRGCGSVARIYLMFDPPLLPHYKVVSFVIDASECRDMRKIYLYSSETHRWKLTNDRIKRSMSFYKGIYFNGGICFLRGLALASSSLIIRDGVVSNIPDPPLHQYPGCWKKHCAKESNGVLFWFTFYWGYGKNILHVCEMKEIENGWSDKYEVDMKPILATCGASSCRGIDVVCMFRAEKEQDPLLMLCLLEKKIVSYRFCDGVCEVVLHSTTAHVHHFIQTPEHCSCLVSLFI